MTAKDEGAQPLPGSKSPIPCHFTRSSLRAHRLHPVVRMSLSSNSPPTISVMLIVSDAGSAIAWYQEALGATILWDLGGVAGLTVAGAPFFVHETNPANPTERSPNQSGITGMRVELFVDDPDAFLRKALEAGAERISPIVHHEQPWGTHRQGGFRDPFGHVWSVGDKSPLSFREA